MLHHYLVRLISCNYDKKNMQLFATQNLCSACSSLHHTKSASMSIIVMSHGLIYLSFYRHLESTPTWPYFKLPPMPPALLSALNARNQDFHRIGRSKLRTKLINYLYEAIAKYTM